MTNSDLASRSLNFARDVQTLLDRTLPGERTIVSVEHKDRYVVRPVGKSGIDRQIPLMVNGKRLATLSLALYQDLDRTRQYLKTYKTDFKVYS